MKRVLKVISLVFLCVIGAFGVMIGGMYLFGGFNEKIVYAQDLAFNQNQIVSSDRILLNITTNTPDVTRKDLKLNITPESEGIIDFPEQVKIGVPFTVYPKQDPNTGKNIGGNVTLIASYDSVDANVGVTARCNILIDIPVENVALKTNSLILKPNQPTTIINSGFLFETAFDVYPQYSLAPYISRGTKKINNIEDKAIYLELVGEDGHTLSTNYANLVVNNNHELTNIIKLNYTVNEDKEIVFDDTIAIQAKSEQVDIKLKTYVYKTYKDQTENKNEENIVLNKTESLSKDLVFTIGAYEITNMTILPTSKNVYLYEDTKIYLNNPNLPEGSHDINLGIELETDSPGITIGKNYILDYVFIQVDNREYRTIKKSNGDAETTATHADGLTAKFTGHSTQKDEWYWVLNINNFFAYYNYENQNKIFEVKVVYNDAKNRYPRTFNVIPKIYEVDSLAVKYKEEGDESFTVKSGKKFNLTSDEIDLVTSLPTGVNPTYTDLAYYISYDKNFADGKSTVSIVPNEKGEYKAKFSFSLLEPSTITLANYNLGELVSAKFVQGGTTYITPFESNAAQVVSPSFEANTKINAEVVIKVTKDITSDKLFAIGTYSDSISDSFDIVSKDVKFYQSLGSDTYSSTPVLIVNGVKYNVDFDYYTQNSAQYLKINDQTAPRDSYVVQGIGYFYITAQLVYTDEFGNIYWLGKRADAKIEAYEELETLSAYKYEGEKDYKVAFGVETIRYNENDPGTYSLFITSDEMDSLKNYINYGQVKIGFNQYYGNAEAANLLNIDDINADAIEFGTWVPVLDEEPKLVGYRISYKIKSVHTIKYNEVNLNSIFKIYVSIDVNGKTVYAEFKLSTEDATLNTDYLDVTIVDKTVVKAKVEYTNAPAAEDGSTLEKAIDLKATLSTTDGTISWADRDLDKNLKYYFAYADADTTGDIDSMGYRLEVVDDSGVNLTNLYTFNMKYNDTSKTGLGGLQLYNFPANLNDKGEQLGVKLKLTVQASVDNEHNTHYAWNSALQTFVKTQNPGLKSSIFFDVYGLNISIEAKQAEVFGVKDKVQGFIENTKEGTTESPLFKVVVKSGANTVIGTINDYSKFMSVAYNSEDITVSNDFMGLTINQDFMAQKDVNFTFYIGSPLNLIKIKQSPLADAKYETFYNQTIKSAFEIAVTQNFNAPSTGNKFVEITYKGEGKEASDLLTVTVQKVGGSEVPFEVVDNLLNFKTVTSAYVGKVKLIITKKEGGSTPVELTYDINVTPLIKSDDLTVGIYDDVEEYYYMNAGSNGAISVTGTNKYIVYSGELLANQNNIESVDITFANKDSSDTLLAETHMDKDVNASEILIFSYDLNYTKDVIVTFVFHFKNNGGEFMCTKEIKILPNLTLGFKHSTIYSNVAGFNLTNVDNYVFTKDGEATTFSLLNFTYDENEQTIYNRTSFGYDSAVFEDISLSTVDVEDFLLKPRSNPDKTGETIETVITFDYYVSDREYYLTFELPLSIYVVS